MLASMKRQFVELLSDIGFTKEGLTVRALERLTRDGGDGVIEASGYEVRRVIRVHYQKLSPKMAVQFFNDICCTKHCCGVNEKNSILN